MLNIRWSWKDSIRDSIRTQTADSQVPKINRYKDNKKLSYCCETVRHESMPKIVEMDVEMTT